MHLLPGLLFACAPGTVLDDVDVRSADIAQVGMVHLGIIGGFEAGGATLDVRTADGGTLAVPVVLAGPMVGFLFDISGGGSVFPVPLVLDDEVVPGSDLLGTYRGLQYGAAFVAGAHGTALFNDAGTGLAVFTVDAGLAGFAGEAWLSVAAARGE
jgi:hypothetical protein